MAEFWDVYDIHRNKTGKLHERGKPLGIGEYHLVIHVWVQNRRGEFLITKRAADKFPFPNCWECTGGSALTGEDSVTAALRETLEETGLDHTDSEKKCILSYTRGDWHGDVWLFTCDFDPREIHLQKEETTAMRLADKETVLSLFHSGEFCGYDYIEEFMKLIQKKEGFFMKNILIIGSINIDLVINTDILPKLGETIHGKNFMTSYGGKGANQAVAVAKLSGKADMIGAVGNDAFGELLANNLKANNINTKGVKVAETNSGVAVITVCGGDNHIILDGGANNEVTPAWIDANMDLIKNADIVIFQLEIPMETIIYAAEKVKECGAKVLLNPAPAAKLPKKLLSYTDILVPNEHEAAIITGYEDEKKALKALYNDGKKDVIITLGSKGCIYNVGKEIKYKKAFEIKAVDSTAAGDSFIGGYCTALCNGMNTDDAIHFASAVSAITVSRPGAGVSIPTREEVEEFLKTR